MSVEPPATDDSVAAMIGAGLLSSCGHLLNGWSMLFALAATLIIGLQPVGVFARAGLAASIFAALVQAYFAARSAFDAAVFAHLGGEPTRYASFDRLLAVWGLKGKTLVVRSVEPRVLGVVLLLRWQASSLFVQITLFVVGLAAVAWKPV